MANITTRADFKNRSFHNPRKGVAPPQRSRQPTPRCPHCGNFMRVLGAEPKFRRCYCQTDGCPQQGSGIKQPKADPEE